ncbi:MAG: glycogen debranching enzyme family protein [Bacteroidales bacterium]|nr:glycogen debranching enzyme family protein [Bacteroidota bacterium]MBL6949425.1 glycogen debranching enzyme family protein [Bacteroidales bacterium]
MSYINFDKNQLVNLEYSLQREMIRSNRAGSYASSTIINCNTRKYHGFLVTPQPGIDYDNHVLLSSVDETVIQQEAEFNLGIHKYKGGKYNPKGHKYIRDFSVDKVPKLVYRVGGVILTRETILITQEDRIIIKYTLEEAHSPTRIRLRPFLAFRNVHHLSKENTHADKKYEKVPGGIRVKMYEGYTNLFMQLSKENEYTHVPDWYYDIEYREEMERGYECLEDLYVPGFFEFDIKRGESVCFSAGTSGITQKSIKRVYTSELKKRIPRDDFEHCLANAAQQFIVKRGDKTDIIAGFPWFGRWGRDTFIALPGLTLVAGDHQTCKAVVDTMIKQMKGPLFPNIDFGQNSSYNSADGSLWFFWALQKYTEAIGHQKLVWKEYGWKMKQILEGYRNGTEFNIHMEPSGLIYAGIPGKAVTWMDAVAYGKPVTPRTGLAVEINALWYNAIMFSLEIANEAGDMDFVRNWNDVAKKIPGAFLEIFWNAEKGMLADYVDGEYTDWSVRPNMVFATSLPFSPVDEEIRKRVLSRIKQELLTTRGLRTLTPVSAAYKGIYFGDQTERDQAYHQGTVWPWLFGHFVEGYLKIHGNSGLSFIKGYYKEFAQTLTEHGVGTISEIYDGDPPHTPRGAISQAWSVAELLRIGQLIGEYEVGER